MNFVDLVSDDPTYEEIVGTPEEIIQGARTFPDLPLETLWARCLRDWTVQAVGRYRYTNELVELPDGSKTTADDWRYEAANAAYGKGKRHKIYCSACELVTFHIAEKGAR